MPMSNSALLNYKRAGPPEYAFPECSHRREFGPSERSGERRESERRFRFRVRGQQRGASAKALKQSGAAHSSPQLTTRTGEPPSAPPASGSRDRPVLSSPVS
ncbi:hypothetical protein NDU88_001869 [Pleurodeles waltl]|uniref:Uncharacterized protein n=1 Tax=Pleurodeles waltl TaxID=8319 RepID=A0AAV7VBE5_PLEWA|nr:hypothetical protein NDU88_001869 [Pleurodeles waltl]